MPRNSIYGYGRSISNITIPLSALNATTQQVVALSLPLGFAFTIEKASYIATVAHAGASGSRTVNVRKGNASGTVVWTANPTTAGLGTAGTVLAGTLTSSAADFTDSDTLTIEVASGGTAITGGQGEIQLVLRVQPQRKS